MTDIELSSAAAKTALGRFLADVKVPAPEGKWNLHQTQNLVNQNCLPPEQGGCGKMVNGQTSWYHNTVTGWVCEHCWNNNQNGHPAWIENAVKELVKSTSKRRSSKASAAKRKQNTVSAKAQPYVEMGLGEPFAEAIARDLSLADSVMDLWEADWWKQYEVDDILIVAVLGGVIQEEDGKWLNTIRSDHEDLVVSCIEKHCTVDWARALMECGLETHSQAVTSILQGGEPELVARIGKIQVNKDLVPPACKPFVTGNSESGEEMEAMVVLLHMESPETDPEFIFPPGTTMSEKP